MRREFTAGLNGLVVGSMLSVDMLLSMVGGPEVAIAPPPPTAHVANVAMESSGNYEV